MFVPHGRRFPERPIDDSDLYRRSERDDPSSDVYRGMGRDDSSFSSNAYGYPDVAYDEPSSSPRSDVYRHTTSRIPCQATPQFVKSTEEALNWSGSHSWNNSWPGQKMSWPPEQSLIPGSPLQHSVYTSGIDHQGRNLSSNGSKSTTGDNTLPGIEFVVGTTVKKRPRSEIQYTRGPWTQREDEDLIALLTDYMNRHESTSSVPWTKIGLLLKRPRTGLQTCARYTEALDRSVKRGRWCKEEDESLMHGYRQYGTRWSVICETIPGRTQRQCASRWTILERQFG